MNAQRLEEHDKSLSKLELSTIMSEPSSNRQVIAIAGAGSLGRYICEELLSSPDFSLVILTRSVHLPLLHPPPL